MPMQSVSYLHIGIVQYKKQDILMWMLASRWVDMKPYDVGGYFPLILNMQMHTLGSTSVLGLYSTVSTICTMLCYHVSAIALLSTNMFIY